jgi:hypothetical protein
MNIPNIPLTPCQSSNIAAHGYDPASKTLALQFKGGGVYHYHDVPAEVAAGLSNAESIGKYVSQSIRGQFKHTAIPASE